MSREEAIEEIIDVLMKNEDHLTDGFEFYVDNEFTGDSEEDDVRNGLRKIAEKILDSIEFG